MFKLRRGKSKINCIILRSGIHLSCTCCVSKRNNMHTCSVSPPLYVDIPADIRRLWTPHDTYCVSWMLLTLYCPKIITLFFAVCFIFYKKKVGKKGQSLQDIVTSLLTWNFSNDVIILFQFCQLSDLLHMQLAKSLW